MSVEAMSWVFKHSQAKGATRLVLLALANEASRDGAVAAYSRSYSHIARQANVSMSTVWRAIEDAEMLGELVVTKSGGGRERNDYQIVLAEPATSPREYLHDAVADTPLREASYSTVEPEPLQDEVAITPFSPVVDPFLSPGADPPKPNPAASARLTSSKRKSIIEGAAEHIAEARGLRNRGNNPAVYFARCVQGVIEEVRDQANDILTDNPSWDAHDLARHILYPPRPSAFPSEWKNTKSGIVHEEDYV